MGAAVVHQCMRMRTRLALVLVMVLCGAAVACSGGDDDATSASGDAASGTDGGASTTAPAAGDDEAEGGGDGVGLPAGDPVQPGRSIIATADVTMEVDDVRRAAARAADAASASGGFLAQQEALPGEGIVTLTLRVPTERFQAVMGEIEALGEVLEQRVDTQDVTAEVVDLESRIASARVSIERVRELLGRSGDVAQLATVEGELARREADLESLLGRQRVLGDQVDLATIRLDLREPAAVVEDDEDDELPGFLGGLRSGWRGFLTTASVLVTGLGYALPFVLLAAVLGGAWVGVARRRRVPPPTG